MLSLINSGQTINYIMIIKLLLISPNHCTDSTQSSECSENSQLEVWSKERQSPAAGDWVECDGRLCGRDGRWQMWRGEWDRWGGWRTCAASAAPTTSCLWSSDGESCSLSAPATSNGGKLMSQCGWSYQLIRDDSAASVEYQDLTSHLWCENRWTIKTNPAF